MKRTVIIVLWMSAIMLPAVAEEPVPYAYRQPALGKSYAPSLAAIMRASNSGISSWRPPASWGIGGSQAMSSDKSRTT